MVSKITARPGLSRSTRSLLAKGESQDVDFKRSVAGLKPVDFVSFANTGDGGTIMLGVGETVASNRTVGELIGTDIDDTTILAIFNSASSCIPPVPIEIEIENTAGKPVVVVKISSQASPHCTSDGTYKLRDGNRNRALHPTELLNILIARERARFKSSFADIAESLLSQFSHLGSDLGERISSIEGSLSLSDMTLDDAESSLRHLISRFTRIEASLNAQEVRSVELIAHVGASDPILARAEERLRQEIKEQLSSDSKLLAHVQSGGSISLKYQPEHSEKLSEDRVRELLSEVVASFRLAKEAKSSDHSEP